MWVCRTIECTPIHGVCRAKKLENNCDPIWVWGFSLGSCHWLTQHTVSRHYLTHNATMRRLFCPRIYRGRCNVYRLYRGRGGGETERERERYGQYVQNGNDGLNDGIFAEGAQRFLHHHAWCDRIRHPGHGQDVAEQKRAAVLCPRHLNFWPNSRAKVKLPPCYHRHSVYFSLKPSKSNKNHGPLGSFHHGATPKSSKSGHF